MQCIEKRNPQVLSPAERGWGGGVGDRGGGKGGDRGVGGVQGWSEPPHFNTSKPELRSLRDGGEAFWS